MASRRASGRLFYMLSRATSSRDSTIDHLSLALISKQNRWRNRLFSTDTTQHGERESPAITRTNPGAGQRDVGEGIGTEAKDPVKLQICGDIEEEDNEDVEEMLQDGPAGKEWGGPTRGGVLGEPTRFGDWERKGRCSDF